MVQPNIDKHHVSLLEAEPVSDVARPDHHSISPHITQRSFIAIPMVVETGLTLLKVSRWKLITGWDHLQPSAVQFIAFQISFIRPAIVAILNEVFLCLACEEELLWYLQPVKQTCSNQRRKCYRCLHQQITRFLHQ